ncbi:protein TRIGALACTOSYLDIACYLGLYCEROL 5, chloroplastic isoform X2 [Cryptomeria japonica]|uniref:protein TRIGALACTOSYLDIACYLGLYCEROL 5, chloroplastic isoform X2 n=1 Tax=Cryptomeria japonica TaxID=3369 RepID=UPI0025AC669D|nr:protein TRIGALACTOSYLDIACYLGLYCEROL 5, chloroplastic isoform X2 [Cryptomeria japonica]
MGRMKRKAWNVGDGNGGKIGPAMAIGIGCGVGVGFGLIGGLGVGVPGLHLGFGVGAGCGVGLGFGYGIGRGWASDNVRNLFGKQGNVSYGDRIEDVLNDLIFSSRKALEAVEKEIKSRRR